MRVLFFIAFSCLLSTLNASQFLTIRYGESKSYILPIKNIEEVRISKKSVKIVYKRVGYVGYDLNFDIKELENLDDIIKQLTEYERVNNEN